MRLLRSAEILAWTVGVALLTTYAATRTWYAYGSEQGVASFDAVRSEMRAKQNAAPAAAEPVDMSKWSRERIARYRASLQADAIADAVLRIPSLKLVVPVFEGTSEENLNRGAGRIPGTAHIGESGNIGIAAHRDGFFRVLKDVRVGHVLQLERLDGIDTYRVVATTIVDPSDVSVLAATSTHAITLVTCYPFYFVGSAPQRFIVRAEKVAAEKMPAGVKPAGNRSRVASEGGATSDVGDTVSEVRPGPD
jgi:sortase A